MAARQTGTARSGTRTGAKKALRLRAQQKKVLGQSAVQREKQRPARGRRRKKAAHQPQRTILITVSAAACMMRSS